MAVAVGLVAVLATTLSSCSEPAGSAGPRSIEVWAHDGTDAERKVLEQQVAAFNDGQNEVEATLRLIAEGDYNDTVQAAIARGNPPAVLEVDGPMLSGYVYQEALAPLDGLVAATVLDAQLPSLQAQGAIDGRTYAVGTFDSGLGLWADRRALRAAGVAWPTSADDAWTADEFAAVLGALAARDRDGQVLDVKLNYGTGEWLTYGFAPLVASAGGALIDAETLSPAGHLDGRAAVEALEQVRSWSRFIDPNAEDDAFTSRRVALSWVGHWAYGDYSAALGQDLLLLPLPDLGQGSKTGQGSWAWTVATSDAATEEAASAFIEYLLSTDEVLRIAEANGAVPGTQAALAASDLYRPGGPLTLFADQLVRSCGAGPPDRECVAVPRPLTPGYGPLTSQFAQAVAVALRGEDPRPALADAARFVGEDLEVNDHYR